MPLTEIDKYAIKKHIGSGAFGKVYLAHDRALDATKAIKVLDIPDPSKFMEKLEEAKILHKCKHKHIVKINEANVYEIDGEKKVVIDMEYLPKGCIEDYIQDQPLSTHETINYIIDCLFALEHAHNQGILHRDIKPANIMLCEYGAKLSDFGLATVLGAEQAGSAKGYTTHLAPEYFKINATTELTDIYAIGITLFRLCNHINNWMDLVHALPNPKKDIIEGKLLSSIGYQSFIPNKVKRIIKKACSINPIQRYQTAFEMKQALDKLQLLIDWKKVDKYNWQGKCKKTKKIFTITLLSKKSLYTVDIKQNKRRLTDLCMVFNSSSQAINYIDSHISKTIIQ